MLSPAVYCSDVMSFPDDFMGTKGLIHPDDLPKLMGALNLMEEKEVPRLDFRIITTYGEVKTISGQRVSLEDEKKNVIEPIPGKEPWEDALQVLAAQKENDFLHLRNELSEFTERLHGIGAWLINRQTGQTWYSDNVFRIYGLAPQTLNAHANTFNHFIHKDDRITVLDAFENAYQEQTPLHIEYRVIRADGEMKYIQQITNWIYAVNGQEIFSGIIRDVTGERAVADELLAAQTQVSLHQQVLKISEQQTTTGYWLTDLSTRKTSYSETYYRIYGFKQPFLPTYNSFLNLVHADDRNRVREHIERMYSEHALSEIEFRIIRPDGKQRHIKQTGKLFVAPGKELIMIGLVQDITVQKGLEKKIIELNETISLDRVMSDMMETALEVSSFTWLPDGYMQWSDGFYRMLGYKPGTVEPLARFLYRNIHPDDLKTFKDAEALLLNHQSHEDIIIKLVSKGGMRKVRMSFRQVNYGKDATIALVHDISKQNEISEQLAENKLFTGLLEDSVNDLVIFTNIDNTVLHWNKVAENKTGIAKEDALYNNLFEVLPQLNEENFLGQVHFVIRGQEVYSSRAIGVYLKRPHDYWLWPLKNEAGEVLGVLHVVQDISKQLELQQQLNERLNFIESLVEASVDRIVVLDRFMNYIYWNKKAEEYYAINKERVLGRNILEIFPSFRNDPSYNEFRRVLKGETVYLPPVASEETDGYFETYLIPVKDDDGEVTAVLWIVHDLSREYQLTKERTETADLLQATMDASTEMIQVLEAVRNEKGEIIDFKYVLLNNEAEKWMPDALGKSLLQLQPGVVEEGIFDTFKNVVETGIPDQSERHYVHEQFNGWFHQSVVKLNDGVATTTTDITQRKLAEQEVWKLKDEIVKKATDKYYSLFNSIDEGFHIIELIYDETGKAVDYRFLETNRSFERHTGLKNSVGKLGSEIAPGTEAHWFKAYDKVVQTGEPIRFENYNAFTGRWYSAYAFPADDTNRYHVGVLFSDITESKQREHQQQFLIKFSDALRAEPDADAITNRAIKMVAEHLQLDRCYMGIALLDDNRGIFPYQCGNDRVPPMPEDGVRLSDFPEALRKTFDETLVVTDFQSIEGLTETEKQNFAALGFGALVVANVRKAGKNPDWSINAVSATPRGWTALEIQLIEEVTERTWAAIERAKAEEALRNSEENYRSLFNAIDEGFAMCELIRNVQGEVVDYRFLDVNPACERQMNIDRSLLIGRLRSEVLPPDQKALEMYAVAVSSGEQLRKEFYSKSTGQWYDMSVYPRTRDQFAVIFENISERKKLDGQLKNFATTLEQQVTERTKELEQKTADLENYKRITDGAHDIIITLDAEGKVDYWNKAAELLYGYTAGEVLGRELSRLIVPEDKLQEMADLRQRIDGGESIFNWETQRRTKSGKLLDIRISYFPLKDKGNIIGSCGIGRDITEQKKWEEAVKKNLTILEHTEQLAQTGSWEYDIATGNFTWSDGMYQLFGLPQNINIRPETYLDFTVEDDRSVAKRIVNNLKKKQEAFEETLRIKKGNEERLLRIKGSVIKDEKGNNQKMVGVDIDITDIQKAKEKLKESRHWLEQTAKASPDSISIYDLRGKQPVYLNNCLADWIGISNEDLLEMGIERRLKLVHPEDRLKLLHHNEKTAAAKDGEVVTTEYRIETHNGKLIWVRNRAKPFLRDASGKVTHILAILQNVTDEVQLREQLKQRTQYAESVIDASIDRIAVYDEQLRIIAWNKRAEMVTGRKKQNVIGQKLFDVFPRVGQDEELLKAHLDALEGNYVGLPAKKGLYTDYYYERFFIPLKNEAGKTYAVVSVMHDVSEQVHRNLELNKLNQSLEQKNVQLEQKNEEITSFAFVASHDMKEPLRKIRTFSDWLLHQETGHLSSSGKDLIQKINTSVQRMEMLIDDILVLTKIHSETHGEEDVDLNSILQEVIQDMADDIQRKHTTIDAKKMPVIKGNSNQLFYLFKNLVSNAVKFQKPGSVPQVTITSEIVNAREDNSNAAYEGYVKLSFADNGFGFDERYAKKIFQVFQRLHGRHEFEGTGIGLAICKKIVENHRGWITVKSKPGEGSVFDCYFPLR